MSEGKGNGEQFRKTVSLQEILKKAEYEEFSVFDEWPLEEVRRLCIKSLKDRREVDIASYAEWAESRIRAMSKQGDLTDWTELLSWYIYNSKSEFKGRALEYAITLAKEKENRYRFLGEISKHLAGKIRNEPEVYWYVPSMREFLKTLLSRIKLTGENTSYMDADWYCAERAIRCIVKVEDIEFLPQIEEILSCHEKEQGKHFSDLDERTNFSRVQRIAFLQEAVRVLLEARKKQMADINIVFGAYLREKAGLLGSVVVRLHCPERIPANQFVYLLDKGLEIRLDLELTKPEEEKKLLPVLKNHAVDFLGEGFIGSKESSYAYQPQSIERVFEGLSWHILVFPSRGANRFSLTLRSREEERYLCKMNREVYNYIYVE